MKKVIFKTALMFLLSIALSGCIFVFQSGRRSDVQKIEELQSELNELKQTKSLLESKLSKEIDENQVRLQMMEKGLVITFVADVLFDSGKSKIRSEAHEALSKVADVLKNNVPQLSVGIEGHTDNEPIQRSSWKSNWELSSARALSVLHYLADKEEISPERLSAIGYGEYRPVASNDTKSGRRMNRRVEIVILPQVTKVKDKSHTSQELYEPTENLK